MTGILPRPAMHFFGKRDKQCWLQELCLRGNEELAKEVKENKKGFFKYMNIKRKNKEYAGPLLNEVGALVTEDIEKAVVECFLCSSLYC